MYGNTGCSAAGRRYQEGNTFGFDLHTTTTEAWVDYLTPFPDGIPNSSLIKETNTYLLKQNISPYREPYVVFMGPNSEYPTGAITESFDQYIWQNYGIFHVI